MISPILVLVVIVALVLGSGLPVVFKIAAIVVACVLVGRIWGLHMDTRRRDMANRLDKLRRTSR